MKKLLPLCLLLTFTLIAFLLSKPDVGIQADGQPPFIVNPAATAAVNANVGGRGLASVGLNGELYAGQPVLAEATVAAMITILPTALPTTLPTPQFANTNASKSTYVANLTNQDILCATSGATVPQYPVPAGSVWTENWASHTNKMSGPIACIRAGTLPTTGVVYIGGNS